MAATYHLELRDFPRSCMRFNQSGRDVGAILIPWVQERVIELDGEKWAPYESTMTIIEGAPIPVERLSMGRGWGIAQREGTNVTERVLEEARRAVADGSAFAQAPAGERAEPAQGGSAPAAGVPAEAEPAPAPVGDRVGPGGEAAAGAPREAQDAAAEILGLLGPDAARLLEAWYRVGARTAGLAPSESLALAERDLRREYRPRP